MSAALDARGLKRVCGCGIRFYDFNKRPVTCPNCGTEFSGEIKLKGRRGRAAAIEEEKPVKTAIAANDGQDTDIEARDEDLVSLEDVEALENGDDDDDAALDEDEDLTTLEDIEEDVDIDVPDDGKKE